MVYVKDYVESKLETMQSKELANHMEISVSMVSQYKNEDNGYNASLEVAKMVYKKDNIVLFPFAEEALKELTK